MILSFGSRAADLPPVALALVLPSVLALAGYVGAAQRSERFASGLRAALLLGWIAHGFAILLDLFGDDYRAYRAHVRCWIPRLRPFGLKSAAIPVQPWTAPR